MKEVLVSDLTPTQLVQVEQLKEEAKKVGNKIALVGIAKLSAMCIVVIALNTFFVQNDLFIVAMTAVSGVMAVKLTKVDYNRETERLREKLKAILEIK